MDFQNNKPTAFITGASRGIGRACAHKLARNGFRLALLSRNKNDLENLANELDLEPGDLLVLPCDVTETTELSKSVAQAAQYFNGIDVALLNHGIYEKSFFATKPGAWRRVMEVNLLSMMEVTELLLPTLMRSRFLHKSLFYTASVASHMRYAGGASYCTSKHGLLGFAHCIFDEVRESGLKVCALCPGFVNTDMIDGDKVNREQAIQPADISELIFNTMSLQATVCPVEIVIRPQVSPYK